MGLSSTALLGRADGQIPDRLAVVVFCVVSDLPVAEAMEQVKVALGRSLGEAGYTCVYLHHARTATPLTELWQHVQPAVVVAFGSLSGRARTRSPQQRVRSATDRIREQRLQAHRLDHHGPRRQGRVLSELSIFTPTARRC